MNTYDKTTTKFLARWGLTPELNEERLARLASGELEQVHVGCDTEKVTITDCFKLHTKYHSGFGYSTRCRLCERATAGLAITKVFSAKLNSIVDCVDSRALRSVLASAQNELDAELAQKEAAEAERAAELGNRTIVHVEVNHETGMWHIVGGAKGRLEKNVFLAALSEMNASTKTKKAKHFDLITQNFAFIVVREKFDEY